MKKILPLIMLIIIIISCSQKREEAAMNDMAMVEEKAAMPLTRQQLESPAPPQEPTPVEVREVVKKKIIKDGRLGIEVKDIQTAKARIDEMVKSHEAYYANENFNNTEFELSYNLIIRVPSASFEKMINDIEAGDGEIQYKAIDARDVTDQFIDMETRLENKKNYLKRYNELLARANSVREILDIEEKIRGLEEEVESTTGRLKYLSDLVDYSTLNLTISEKKDFHYNPVSRDKFTEKLKQSLSKGWYGFVDFLLFVIKIWPLWIIAAVIIYLLKKTRRNKKRVLKDQL
jgi:PBP1b-binding outer membrane lipoprotein LpoB